MNSLLEYKGEFFLPNKEEHKAYGILTIDAKENISLELNKGFPGVYSSDSITILGILENGQKITLLQCDISHFSPTDPLDRTGYTVKGFIRGLHFNSFDEVRFDNISFRCTNLEAWLDNCGFKYNRSAKTVSLKYTPSNPINATTTEGFEISIKTHVYPAPIPPSTEVTFTERAYVTFSFKQAIGLDEIQQKQFVFMSFLDMAIGRKQTVFEDYAVVGREKINMRFVRCNVNEIEKASPHRMLFTFRDIRKGWPNKIKKWFESYRQKKLIYDWYFSLCLSKNNFVEQNFLHLSQFLESYHRKTYPLSKEESKKRRDRIKNILDNISDKKDKKYLTEKTAFAHEDSFKERILDLLNKCTISKEILSIKDNNSFANKIRDARNYYTHLKTEGLPTPFYELMDTSIQMNKLAKYYLLGEIAFTKKERSKMLVKPINNFL